MADVFLLLWLPKVEVLLELKVAFVPTMEVLLELKLAFNAMAGHPCGCARRACPAPS